jgi:hypothetical protein
MIKFALAMMALQFLSWAGDWVTSYLIICTSVRRGCGE